MRNFKGVSVDFIFCVLLNYGDRLDVLRDKIAYLVFVSHKRDTQTNIVSLLFFKNDF